MEEEVRKESEGLEVQIVRWSWWGITEKGTRSHWYSVVLFLVFLKFPVQLLACPALPRQGCNESHS